MKHSIVRLQKIQSSVMDDVCNIIHYYHNTGTVTTAMVSGVACGIDYVDGEVAAGLAGTLNGFNIELRLPSSQILLLTDLVEVVQKGETAVSGTYQVASYPEYNSTVQKIKLKRVK